MSGSNPFRHKKPVEEAVAAQQPPTTNHDLFQAGQRFPSLTVETPPIRSSPKPKTVRIASPPVPISPETPISFPSSPELSRHTSRTGSPPPSGFDTPSFEESSPSNPFHPDTSDAEDEDDREVQENTRRNSATTIPQPPRLYGEPLPDPVRSTLARFASGPRRTSGEAADGASKPKASERRSTMDVDAFTRLLLTGGTGAGSKPSSIAPSQQTVVSDSSSSTDTASVSRQSIFEPMPPLQADTPRTSHESSASDADEERTRLVDEMSSETRKKPPPPRVRHGKLIKSQPPSSNPTQPNEPEPAPGLSSVGQEHGRTSDLNKPLPLPPVDQSFPSPPESLNRDPVSSAQKEIPLTTVSKRPPTPPLTRRASQRPHSIGKSIIPRSNSTRVISDASSSASTSTPTHPPKTAPPPPLRRTGTDLSSLSDADTFTPTTSTTSPPPVPPSRSTSQSHKRTSITNRPSSSDPTNSPRQAAAMAPPPLPPPRRHRNSDRSSLEGGSRPFLASLDTGNHSRGSSGEFTRRPSADLIAVSSNENTPPRETPPLAANKVKRTDVLADLEALQREVDEMRQAGKKK